jgi:hypothetical protein
LWPLYCLSFFDIRLLITETFGIFKFSYNCPGLNP